MGKVARWLACESVNSCEKQEVVINRKIEVIIFIIWFSQIYENLSLYDKSKICQEK